MTLRKILPLSLLAFSLTACGIMSQPPAPVEQGSTGGVQPTPVSNNPYGATEQDDTPYTPPAVAPAPVQVAPQPVSSGSSYVPPNSTYIPSNAPVDPNATTHTVVYGDTVYNLSKRYNINADELRSLNNIVDNNITIGQVLRLPNRERVATPTPVQSVPEITPTPVTTPVSSAPVVSGATRQVAGITWTRPTNGQIFSNFGGTNKGVKYSGTAGQPVYAAADGEVKYSGSGLRGYGNLLIIQHNSKYLTAYGNNSAILVKEGQKVKRGQQIAQMGSTDATRTQLHFEVRENGTAVDPTKFIP